MAHLVSSARSTPSGLLLLRLPASSPVEWRTFPSHCVLVRHYAITARDGSPALPGLGWFSGCSRPQTMGIEVTGAISRWWLLTPTDSAASRSILHPSLQVHVQANGNNQ